MYLWRHDILMKEIFSRKSLSRSGNKRKKSKWYSKHISIFIWTPSPWWNLRSSHFSFWLDFHFLKDFWRVNVLCGFWDWRQKISNFFLKIKTCHAGCLFSYLNSFYFPWYLSSTPTPPTDLQSHFENRTKKTFFLEIRKLVKKSLSFYLPKSNFVSEKKKSRNFFQLRNLPRMVSFLTLGTCLHSFKHITVPNLYNRLTKIFLKIEQPWFWSTWNP